MKIKFKRSFFDKGYWAVNSFIVRGDDTVIISMNKGELVKTYNCHMQDLESTGVINWNKLVDNFKES